MGLQKIDLLFQNLGITGRYSIWPFPVFEFQAGLEIGLQAFSIATDPADVVGQSLASHGIQLNLLQQVHGCNYSELTTTRVEAVADAWLWSGKQVPADAQKAYGIYTADCIPVLMYVEYLQWHGGALLHLGRKGIELGLLEKCFGALIERLFQQLPLDLQWQQLRGKQLLNLFGELRGKLFLGPGIGACCYEVPTSMAQEFCVQARVSQASRPSFNAGHQMLDCKMAICEQARNLKFCNFNLQWQIYVEELCTSCQAKKYIQQQGAETLCYSYRQGHRTERIYTMVWFCP